MSAESIAPLVWGIQIGAWGFYLLNAKFNRAKPTFEHEIGSKIIASANSALFKLSFAPNCTVTHSMTLKTVGKPDVEITLSATRPDLEEVPA